MNNNNKTKQEMKANVPKVADSLETIIENFLELKKELKKLDEKQVEKDLLRTRTDGATMYEIVAGKIYKTLLDYMTFEIDQLQIKGEKTLDYVVKCISKVEKETGILIPDYHKLDLYSWATQKTIEQDGIWKRVSIMAEERIAPLEIQVKELNDRLKKYGDIKNKQVTELKEKHKQATDVLNSLKEMAGQTDD